MSYMRQQPATGFPLGRDPHIGRVGPTSMGYRGPAAYTSYSEPPESPAWGVPVLPDPRKKQHGLSMSATYYRQQNLPQASQIPPPAASPQPPVGIQHPIPRLTDPFPQRKKTTSFFSKAVNLKDLISNANSHYREPRVDTNNNVRRPHGRSFDNIRPLIQHTQGWTSNARHLHARPQDLGSGYGSVQDRSQHADAENVVRNVFDFPQANLCVTEQVGNDAGVNELLDRKWRSWQLPHIHLDSMQKVKLLGSGSSGTVYCARIREDAHRHGPKHLQGKLVAAKLFRRETFDSGAVEVAADKAFSKVLEFGKDQNETQAWIEQHIVRLVGKSLGHSDLGPALHSEYCEGGEVMSYLEKSRHKPRLQIQFATDLLKAVHACHVAGIVHLDIKVENCFVFKGSDRQPVLKLGDFGGAMKYPIVGSPKACSFPPPEVTLCEQQAPLTPAWDVWAAGVAVSCILGSDRDASMKYQHISNVRCAKREFPIHTIENIADLRAGILMPDRWSKRPSGEMIRWLAAAFTYDEDIGPKQNRPSALELLDAFPRFPFS